MAEETKCSTPAPVIEIELKIYMHCKACEKSVFKTLCKYKGVEEVKTDMEEHKATVRGQIDPKKLLKKLKKTTGKRAEIIQKMKDQVEDEMNSMPDDTTGENEDHVSDAVNDSFSEINGVINFHVFSDENPNGCSIM